VVGTFYLTIAALWSLLCDITLDLFVDVIALEAGAWVFLTFSFTLQLCGDDVLEGHSRWRWCLLQLEDRVGDGEEGDAQGYGRAVEDELDPNERSVEHHGRPHAPAFRVGFAQLESDS
jgi:hypothetical protein